VERHDEKERVGNPMSGKTIAIRKPKWYRMTQFFDGASQVVTEINDAEVLLQGVLYEAVFPCPKCGAKVHMDKIKLKEDGTADLSPQLGLCLIPHEAIGNQQGEALRRMLEANLRMPVLLISNNVQMVRLKPISQQAAHEILKGANEDGQAEGRLVAFTGGDRQEEQGSGEGARAGGGDGPASDPGAGTPPEDGRGTVQTGDPEGDSQEESRGDPVGGDEGSPGAPEAERDPAG
jgi:hypothetical protein